MVVLEKASFDERCGNSLFTAGGFRFVHSGIDDVRKDVLADLLIGRSRETMVWMRSNGVRFIPMFGRRSFKVDGKHHFYGGVNIEAVGGGWGLVDALIRRAEKMDIVDRSGRGRGDVWPSVRDHFGRRRSWPRCREVADPAGGPEPVGADPDGRAGAGSIAIRRKGRRPASPCAFTVG